MQSGHSGLGYKRERKAGKKPIPTHGQRLNDIFELAKQSGTRPPRRKDFHERFRGQIPT